MTQLSTQERFKRGAADAGRYFHFVSEFIGFTPEDAATIRETRFIVEKYIPTIVANFYAQLLRYPATKRPFQQKDGRIDHDYLKMRMHHQANFWRRTASGVYDEDYARFVDYVGRAHTSQGADPTVYIPERYVMGMIGFVQRELGTAITAELHDIDPDFEVRALKAWNALLMVLLEMVSRPYGHGREEETFEAREAVDDDAVFTLALETYERALGIARSIEYKEVHVGRVAEIPDGQRRLIQVDDLSIGVFHHKGTWYALHNSCLHRGGPVCAGELDNDTITCPWHGYQYNLPTGQLLLDRSATLPMYPVELRGDDIYIRIPVLIREPIDISLDAMAEAAAEPPLPLQPNELRRSDLPPGQAQRVHVDGVAVAVYNIDGSYYASQDACTHVGGPLSEGELKGQTIICPWHGSCFDVTSGEATCPPAVTPLQRYQVVVTADMLRIENGATS